MEAIKDTVSHIMQSWEKKKKGLSQDGPEPSLKKVLTKKELSHIRVNYFRNGTLGLKVDSSPWLYHFSLKKDALLTKLNQKTHSIKEVNLSIGEVYSAKEKTKKTQTRRKA